jgi:hypothetical protein
LKIIKLNEITLGEDNEFQSATIESEVQNEYIENQMDDDNNLSGTESHHSHDLYNELDVSQNETADSSASESQAAQDISDLALLPSNSILSDDQKYKILITPTSPVKVYPTNHQKQRFQPGWTQTFPWIRYSKSTDGIYCAPCVLFNTVVTTSSNNELVKVPFKDWKNAVGKKRGTLDRHSVTQLHQSCNNQASTFIAVMENRQKFVKTQLSVILLYSTQVEQNAKALLCVIDSLQFLIKQGLPVRGHNWSKETRREDGNFSSMIDFLAKYSSDLASHLQSSARNVNVGLIRKTIIEKCNSALFWSVMADETTDVSTSEQLSICIRYLHHGSEEELEVCEDFIGFCYLPLTNAETITTTMITFLKNCDLNMDKLVGKGFHGAATMSGHVSGVSTTLQQEYPNAKYFTHCQNHALNLAIVASCTSVPEIRNFMNTLKELTLFFKYSPKRKGILKEHFKNNNDHQDLLTDISEDYEDDLLPSTRYQGLPMLSDTRWLSRVDSIHCLLKHYRTVCEVQK